MARRHQARIAAIVFGKGRLRDRKEEEIRGYRDALKLIHERGPSLPVSEETVRQYFDRLISSFPGLASSAAILAARRLAGKMPALPTEAPFQAVKV